MPMGTRTLERPSSSSNALSIRQVRGEYEEMPCLRLTLAQAARFWNVDQDACRAVLDALVVDGYLIEGRFGYMRA